MLRAVLTVCLLATTLPAAASERLGAIEVPFAGGTLQPGFRLQLEARSASQDDWTLHAGVRRLRFKLGGKVLDDRVAFNTQINAVPGSVELLDAWVEGTGPGDVKVRGGLFRVPFSRYGDSPTTHSATTDLALPLDTFGAERQLGVMVRRGGAAGFAWRAAVVTGTATRPTHATGVALLYGETVPDWADLTGVGGALPVHPEVVGRVEWNSEGLDPARVADFDRGPLRVHVSLSAAWDLEPTVAQDLSARVAPEVMVKSGGIAANLVGYLGFVDTWAGAGAVYGAVLEATWAPVERWELAARTGVVAPSDRVLDDAGSAERTQFEAAVGGNHYWARDGLKAQVEGSWLRDPGLVDEEVFQVRIQLQLAL